MTDLERFYHSDFPHSNTISDKFINRAAFNIPEDIILKSKIMQNADSSCRFFIFYISQYSESLRIIKVLIDNFDILNTSAQKIIRKVGYVKDIELGIHSSVYSRRLYVYMETSISKEEKKFINELCNKKNILLTIRNHDHMNLKKFTEKAVAFISHDSRDKDAIARPIAEGLIRRSCFIWYDEYALKAGDSLRETIQKGIKESEKCILILSKNFLNNGGWGKKEFNSIFTKEIIEEKRLIVPVWYDITRKEVYEYSPDLADTFAVIWPKQNEKDIRQHIIDIEKSITKIYDGIVNKEN